MKHALATLVASTFLASCTMPVTHPDFTGLPTGVTPESFTCCADPERMPRWFADAAKAVSESLEPMFGADDASGLLAPHPKAAVRLAGQAQPLDLFVFSSKTQFSSRLLPGWFTHSAIYLGTEAQLRAAGWWFDPAIRPYHADIRAGRTVVQASSGSVNIDSLPHVMGKKDAAALLRPQVSPALKREVLARALTLVGRKFDYEYDGSNCDCIACSELVFRSFPELEFPVREIHGVASLLPDDIAAKAIRGDRLRLLDYVRADDSSWSAAGVTGAMSDVAAFWGPMPDTAQTKVVGSDVLGTCPTSG
ncbi:YiiX/YebB-like N1pC/P60 family cysteine hydrolase [Maritimibacter sp. UBA3975]|uniref:YiiX/YebB-like N1pC/P60 family cysteine hydrolase n=1 Tax=Maritimibacter sp. UBA3975 TaxID=1946833 RepID=UPI000C0ADB02|nr:YiiX/YebB-like N1pC/P60 family cysteine hydrolase [Maritimibacter sp. UBA3975]MAM63937.1 hypothetical protein [Maritimibacter sp.]|tara:strand:+ start:1080 stop:1997 length:918 start_codon:yes stop_codon:yes gene_type:complete